MRIVSLLPSTTEILFAIGAGDDVVGVTFECDWPAEAKTRRIISTSAMTEGLSPAEIDAEVRARMAAGEDLYRLDEGALADLDADVVVTQDLCAVCAVAVSEVDDALAHLGCTADVVTVDPFTLDEVVESIGRLGAVTGRQAEADALMADSRRRLDGVAKAVAGRPRPRVALLEWTEPFYAPGHWLPDMVVAAGGDPVIGAAGQKAVGISDEDVRASHPDVVIVSPCGYRLAGAADLAEKALGRFGPDAQVWAVDADAEFVRPGPRVVDGVETLAAILHPDVAALRPDAAVRIR